MRRFLLLAVSAALTPVLGAPAQEANQNARVGLTVAIQSVLEKQPGYVLEIEPEDYAGKRIYQVDVIHENKITQVDVDAVTGTILETEADSFKNRMKSYLTSERIYSGLKEAKIPMHDAVGKAEVETSAKAVKAQFEMDRERSMYAVTLVDGDKRIMAIIDANTGETISVKR